MKASWVFLFVFKMMRTATFKFYLNVCLTPGAGTLRAKFELSNGPSTPSTLAVQFLNEGTTLSGADMELQGSGYRLSLNKKRFATGMTDAPSAGQAVVNNSPTTQTPLFFPQDDTWQTAEVTHHSALKNKTKT